MRLLLRYLIHTIQANPRLFVALTLAVLVGLLIPHDWVWHPATRLLIAWNVGTCTYLVFAAHMCLQSTPETIRRRAGIQAESRLLMIGLSCSLLLPGWVPSLRSCRSSRTYMARSKLGTLR